MKSEKSCRDCMYNKNIDKIPSDASEEKRTRFIAELEDLMGRYLGEMPAPWMSWKVDELYRNYFGIYRDYGPIKAKYNRYMLSVEDVILREIKAAEDKLKRAIQYVCAGNYIDFGALGEVKDSLLSELLSKAEGFAIDGEELICFKEDLSKARRLVYLTDNCGEIVLDKLLISLLLEMYPKLDICVIVRGGDAINDATMEDAQEVGLAKLVTCIGNGKPIPGTVIEELSEEAKTKLDGADVIIAKGQGNFESMCREGYNPYYLFLCKCDLFTNRFGVERFTSVFCKEERLGRILA